MGGERGARFTSRAMILLAVLAVLVVSYASSLRAYLEQRSQISALNERISSSQAAIDDLEREQRRWEDDAYVEAQARERFGWVLPGETAYQVLDEDGKPLVDRDRLRDPGSAARSTPDAWWAGVGESFAAADHPEDVPVPAEKIAPPAPSSPSGP